MIHPSCLEVLATVQTAFSREIVPRLKDVDGRSTAATIEHLLRHIALRIEHEGQILVTDISRLVDLLDSAARWMDKVSLDATSLRAALAGEAQAATAQYRNLDQLGTVALELRGELVKVQGLLADREADEAADALRKRIREYVGLQLTDEAQLIEPAYTGKGPRR